MASYEAKLVNQEVGSLIELPQILKLFWLIHYELRSIYM